MALLARPSLIGSLLVRRSIVALASQRHHCAHCGRTPLVGERVYRYEGDGRRAELVCELCRRLRREAPTRSELVMPVEHAGSIRITRGNGLRAA